MSALATDNTNRLASLVALNDPGNKISDELYFRGVAAVEACDLAAEQARMDAKGYDSRETWTWDED